MECESHSAGAVVKDQDMNLDDQFKMVLSSIQSLNVQSKLLQNHVKDTVKNIFVMGSRYYQLDRIIKAYVG